MSLSFHSRLLGPHWWVLLGLCGFILHVSAAELTLEARLIWGTDEQRSPDPGQKPVDPITADKLRNIFKWKSYFVVNRLVQKVPSRSSNRFELSKQCTVEIRELEGAQVEVKLIGDGKEVHKTTKKLSKGEWFTYAGDAKGQSAWFVIITELDEK